MAKITINRSHSLEKEQAKHAANEVALRLAEEFDIHYQWQEFDLHFSRSGVKGRIFVTEDAVDVYVELGLLLSAFRGHIEQEINGYLDRLL